MQRQSLHSANDHRRPPTRVDCGDQASCKRQKKQHQIGIIADQSGINATSKRHLSGINATSTRHHSVTAASKRDQSGIDAVSKRHTFLFIAFKSEVIQPNHIFTNIGRILVCKVTCSLSDGATHTCSAAQTHWLTGQRAVLQPD